jgi:hypothetical protein
MHVALDPRLLGAPLDHATDVAAVELAALERGEEARARRPPCAPRLLERLKGLVDRDDAVATASAGPFLVSAMGFAALLMAAGLLTLRTGVFARWTGSWRYSARFLFSSHS